MSVTVLIALAQVAAPPPVIISPHPGVNRQPACPPEPCIEVDGRRFVHVGWFVDGSVDQIDKLRSALRPAFWSVTDAWRHGDHFRARIYTYGKTADELLALDRDLKRKAFAEVESEILLLPSVETAK